MQSAQEYRELQVKIDVLTAETIGETFEWIRKSSIYQKKDGAYEILSLLLQYSYIRPLNLNNITILGKFILQPFSNEQRLDMLIRNLRSNSSPFGGRSSENVIFFINIVDLLEIPKTLVIDNLIDSFTEGLFDSDDNFALFVFLGPDLEKYNSNLFKTILKQYQESLPKWVSNFSRVKSNDWALMKQYREEFGIRGGVNYSIRADDLSALRLGLINPNFRLDSQLSFTIYEPTVQISSLPTIFDYALFCGSPQIIDFFLTTIVPKHQEMLNEPTHAQYAVAGGKIEVVKKLKENKFNFDGSLIVSVMFHQREIFDWLLQNTNEDKTKISPIFGSILHAALKFDNFDTSLFYVNENLLLTSSDKKNRTPLHVAVSTGILANVDMILSKGDVDVNAVDKDGMSPLMLAVENNNEEITKRLLQIEKLDIETVDDIGLTAIGHAACNGYTGILKLLLERKDIDVNRIDEEGMTPIMSAFESEEYETCVILAKDKRTNLDVQNYNGLTMLHLSAGGLSFELFKAVLERSDVNSKDNEGRKIIHIVSTQQDLNFINLAIEKGADYKEKDDNGMSPLHHACRSGNVAVTELLVQKNDVDVNDTDNNGLTPLHYAVNSNNAKNVCKVLFDSGRLNPNLASKGNERPIMISVRKCDFETVQLFLEHDGINVEGLLKMINNGKQNRPLRDLVRKYQDKQKQQ
ncbi:hypothetical protein TVAG_102350 [Trichomonas vaginalis G3]|uniref:Uncharacterized protein n=1 Tax=Trichomonas vaginalis (strain ATCC PRA-98 / G3) TaxID=412133 RepID=A2ECU1_TRIV3|nr:protein ubiquitination [Trichomonas vaginalis G3]EAY09486.1 hypothetical protein TVAG_102350 [Trichomonas vaginalis G3]KAI5521417.1 protein ubiquitination [Trichomonas vaginalis G3]|eukprot:XP_001321709.1 hypothetical protein [Trichomonas vaginalis G3]